jgi:hypothetical protein
MGRAAACPLALLRLVGGLPRVMGPGLGVPAARNGGGRQGRDSARAGRKPRQVLFFSVCLSVCLLSVCLSVCTFLLFSVSVSLRLSLFKPLCHSLSATVSASVSMCLSRCLCVFVVQVQSSVLDRGLTECMSISFPEVRSLNVTYTSCTSFIIIQK